MIVIVIVIVTVVVINCITDNANVYSSYDYSTLYLDEKLILMTKSSNFYSHHYCSFDENLSISSRLFIFSDTFEEKVACLCFQIQVKNE